MRMEWFAAIYRGTNKLHVGVNGQHNADAMESGIVAMAQQLGVLIKRTGARPPLGAGKGDDPMSDGSASLTGGMRVLYTTELEPWPPAAQVQALIIEGLGVDPMELGSISQMRWNVGDRGTSTWWVSIMGTNSHEGTVILTEDCACSVLFREQYIQEKQQ